MSRSPTMRLAFLIHAFCAPGNRPLTMPEARGHAIALRRAGILGARLAVIACNRPMQDWEVKTAERVNARFNARCATLGLKPNVSDPRGYCYHVIFPDKPSEHAACAGNATLPSTYNTWGGKSHGYGVTGQ